MGALPNRKYAVVCRSHRESKDESVIFFASIESALTQLKNTTDHAIVFGGGEIFESLIGKVEVIHRTTVHLVVNGDTHFSKIPDNFTKVFDQFFPSNETNGIWKWN